MSRLPIPHIINTIKTKLGFDRTMTASGEDVVDAVNKQSQQIDNVKAAVAYVEDGNTASRTYTAGQFVLWKGLLYTVKPGGLPQNETISTTTYLDSVTDGGGLNDIIAVLNSNRITDVSNIVSIYKGRINASFLKTYKYGEHYVRGFVKGTFANNLSSDYQTMLAIDRNFIPVTGNRTIVGKAIIDGTTEKNAIFNVGSANMNIDILHNGVTAGQTIQVEYEWYI